jgi:Ion channel
LTAVGAVAAAAGILLVLILLWDAYETILLPRRLPADIRVSRLLFRALWRSWTAWARRIPARNRRELFLSFYPQLALMAVLGVWAFGIIAGFAILHWSLGSAVEGGGMHGFGADLYLSGSTFFTLGLGDVVPTTGVERLLTVAEAGLGFGFLALVIAYVPVLYQSFAPREARITMLDEWAGSPPTAGQIVKRAFESSNPGAELDRLFRAWEAGSANILESHLSYPILAFFRSQHDNQSWLASLCAVIDAAAVVSAGVRGIDPFQARLTFAIGRHTLVDVSQVLRLTPRAGDVERNAPERLAELRRWLAQAGVPVDEGTEAVARMEELGRLYAPYVGALSEYLVMPLPAWVPAEKARFNWRTTAAGRVHDGAH